ncbi:MAG: hypothetical protein AAF513_18395 [Pseudomonadota bacterium]
MTEDLTQLCKAYRSQFEAGFRATIKLDWGAGSALLQCADQSCEVVDDTQAYDMALLFSDAASALALLRGQANPIDAFMRGEFRATGYIVWAFTLLRCFPAGTD